MISSFAAAYYTTPRFATLAMHCLAAPTRLTPPAIQPMTAQQGLLPPTVAALRLRIAMTPQWKRSEMKARWLMRLRHRASMQTQKPRERAMPMVKSTQVPKRLHLQTKPAMRKPVSIDLATRLQRKTEACAPQQKQKPPRSKSPQSFSGAAQTRLLILEVLRHQTRP